MRRVPSDHVFLVLPTIFGLAVLRSQFSSPFKELVFSCLVAGTFCLKNVIDGIFNYFLERRAYFVKVPDPVDPTEQRLLHAFGWDPEDEEDVEPISLKELDEWNVYMRNVREKRSKSLQLTEKRERSDFGKQWMGKENMDNPQDCIPQFHR